MICCSTLLDLAQVFGIVTPDPSAHVSWVGSGHETSWAYWTHFWLNAICTCAMPHPLFTWTFEKGVLITTSKTATKKTAVGRRDFNVILTKNFSAHKITNVNIERIILTCMLEDSSLKKIIITTTTILSSVYNCTINCCNKYYSTISHSPPSCFCRMAFLISCSKSWMRSSILSSASIHYGHKLSSNTK